MALVIEKKDMLLQRLRERLAQEDLELIDLQGLGQDALFTILGSLGFNPIDRVKVQSVLRIFADEGGVIRARDYRRRMPSEQWRPDDANTTTQIPFR